MCTHGNDARDDNEATDETIDEVFSPGDMVLNGKPFKHILDRQGGQEDPDNSDQD